MTGTAPHQGRPHQLHCVGHQATQIIIDHMYRRAKYSTDGKVPAALARILKLPGIQEKLITRASPGARTALVTAPSHLLLELHTHVLQNNAAAIDELYLIHCKNLPQAG